MLSTINNKIATFEHKPRVFQLSHIQVCQSALHHPVSCFVSGQFGYQIWSCIVLCRSLRATVHMTCEESGRGCYWKKNPAFNCAFIVVRPHHCSNHEAMLCSDVVLSVSNEVQNQAASPSHRLSSVSQSLSFKLASTLSQVWRADRECLVWRTFKGLVAAHSSGALAALWSSHCEFDLVGDGKKKEIRTQDTETEVLFTRWSSWRVYS